MQPVKVLASLCLAVVVGIFLIGPAFSSPLPVKELLSKQSLAKAPEKEAVEAAIMKGKPLDFLVRHKDELGRSELIGVASPAELATGEPFKVFVPNAAVVQALIENKPITPLLECCHYYWEFPVLTEAGTPVASFRVENFQENWQVVEVGGNYREVELKLLTSPGQIEALLREYGIGQADAYAHFTLPSLHTDFLILVSSGTEYFLPLIHGGVREAWGLQSGKLYPRQAVANAVGPALEEMQAQPGKEMGNPVTGASPSPLAVVPIYAGGILLAALASLALLYVRRAYRG